jgi:acetyl-CoA synthetase
MLSGVVKARLDWIKPYTRVKDTDFTFGKVSIKWFEDGVLNVSANCIDRHLTRAPDRDHLGARRSEDARAPHHLQANCPEQGEPMANVLLAQGVMRGDRVVIYMPMIPEAAYAMLACARIGAIHSIVFAGFSPDALANRINDSGAKLVITADFAPRGGQARRR